MEQLRPISLSIHDERSKAERAMMALDAAMGTLAHRMEVVEIRGRFALVALVDSNESVEIVLGFALQSLLSDVANQEDQ